MRGKLNIAFFAHSWVSDWNHGNAHFLRGLVRSLIGMGHQVRCYEQARCWSLTNLIRHEAESAIAAIDDFNHTFPYLDLRFYENNAGFPDYAENELRGMDAVIIHEWNEPEVVNAILDLKTRLGFRALLHDTHHRAHSNPGELLKFHLPQFDGVLAFGEVLRGIYREGFGMPKVWVFHEAADTELFKPLPAEKKIDLLWIGNWGDEERSAELQDFFVALCAHLARQDRAASRCVAHGVRYPANALRMLEQAGVDYRGYLCNLKAPEVYAQSRLALHVPRRQYADGLSGIPTIRVFEALACGIPLVCSPWTDTEGLFLEGTDYVMATDGRAMQAIVPELLQDEAARRQLGENGLQTIRSRHTCTHRAAQLTEIISELEN